MTITNSEADKYVDLIHEAHAQKLKYSPFGSAEDRRNRNNAERYERDIKAEFQERLHG